MTTFKDLASCTLHDSNVSPVSYNTHERHPFTFFVEGSAQKREDLLSHPQVKSLLFLSKDNLIKMFFPRIVKEFDSSGSCTTKVDGVVGKTVENCSIMSITVSDAFSNVITSWTMDNLITFQKGKELPSEMFRQSVDSKDNKPWTPSLHPDALFRIPTCIIKFKGHKIISGQVLKPSVRLSLQTYSHTAVDWLDTIVAHRANLKKIYIFHFQCQILHPRFPEEIH